MTIQQSLLDVVEVSSRNQVDLIWVFLFHAIYTKTIFAMALATSHFVGLFIFFLGLITSGDGMKCWECNSERDYNCRDPFNYTHFPLVDCDRKAAHNTYLQSYSVCRKTVHRVNGELQVERSCAWEQTYDSNRPCSSIRSTPYSTVEHCSTCHTDACNGGTTIFPAFTSVVVTVVSYYGAKHL